MVSSGRGSNAALAEAAPAPAEAAWPPMVQSFESYNEELRRACDLHPPFKEWLLNVKSNVKSVVRAAKTPDGKFLLDEAGTLASKQNRNEDAKTVNSSISTWIIGGMHERRIGTHAPGSDSAHLPMWHRSVEELKEEFRVWEMMHQNDKNAKRALAALHLEANGELYSHLEALEEEKEAAYQSTIKAYNQTSTHGYGGYTKPPMPPLKDPRLVIEKAVLEDAAENGTCCSADSLLVRFVEEYKGRD